MRNGAECGAHFLQHRSPFKRNAKNTLLLLPCRNNRREKLGSEMRLGAKTHTRDHLFMQQTRRVCKATARPPSNLSLYLAFTWLKRTTPLEMIFPRRAFRRRRAWKFNDYLHCWDAYSRNLHRECRGWLCVLSTPWFSARALFSSVINPRAARASHSSHMSVFWCRLPKHTNTLTQRAAAASVQMGSPPPKSIICV